MQISYTSDIINETTEVIFYRKDDICERTDIYVDLLGVEYYESDL